VDAAHQDREARMKTSPLAVLLAVAVAPTARGFTPAELWEAWPRERFVSTPAPCLRHAELEEHLAALAARHPGRLIVEEVGRSAQGRAIRLLTLGRGARKVLLWSQMHGDEPSATPALLDVADVLLTRERAGDTAAAAVLDGLTLLLVPMLNPDGAEVYGRQNAQAIDVNRDALDLATPEGRLLAGLRDEHEPLLGFNLHDQDRRRTVGDTGVLATHAVLAVAGDAANTLTPGRLRAKRACAAIVAALAPFAPGGMARYGEEWNPRAFGDLLTARGTPVVLLEGGGLPPGRPFEELTRLTFVALLRVLEDLALDDLAGHDPALYDALPDNAEDAWVDVAVRGGSLRQPGTAQAYRADLAFDVLEGDRRAAGCADEPVSSRVVEVGDARLLAAGREVAGEGRVLLAPFVAGVRGWAAHRWLDAAGLARLARSGVGRVRWLVAPRRLAVALRHASGLAGEGRPRLEVVTAPADLPWLVLAGPPAAPGSDRLAAALEALVGPARWRRLRQRPVAEALDLLWAVAPGDAWPALRRGGPASFLLVSSHAPGAPADLDLERSRLLAVWLDGVERPPGAP
jgi:hypothetical protein